MTTQAETRSASLPLPLRVIRLAVEVLAEVEGVQGRPLVAQEDTEVPRAYEEVEVAVVEELVRRRSPGYKRWPIERAFR
jgi:hypothetical protein